jgi:hypothetical protein
MASLLSKLYTGFPLGSIGNTNVAFKPFTGGTNFSGFSFSPKTQTLPNAGGTIQTVTPTPTPVVPAEATKAPPQYVNPSTGGFYTPEQVAANITKNLPKGYDIPTYAGNTLMRQAAGLTNARNDIATGQTDPYAAASQSGVAYSPEEMKAIEKAYAGIYDPAINDAISRLDAYNKQKEADVTFQRQVALKQTPTYGQLTGTDEETGAKLFTSTQLNKGASNAALDIATFKALNSDVKNFFINTPTGVDPNTNKSVPMYKIFEQALAEVTSGKSTAEEITQEIVDSNLPDAVKQYFIDKMPLAPEAKQGFLQQLWSAISGT